MLIAKRFNPKISFKSWHSNDYCGLGSPNYANSYMFECNYWINEWYIIKNCI